MYPYNYPIYQNYVPQGVAQQNAAQMQAQTQQMQQPQAPMINADFVKVHSELEARNYPVGTGNSVTFKDENAPYIYTKTMGFSQLDTPVFEKYRLVKEDIAPTNEVLSESTDKLSLEALKADIEDVRGQIEDIKRKINTPAKKKTLKEDIEDE